MDPAIRYQQRDINNYTKRNLELDISALYNPILREMLCLLRLYPLHGLTCSVLNMGKNV